MIERARCVAAVAGAAISLAVPCAAQAAVTIGASTATPSVASFGCGPNPAQTCTLVQTAHPTLSYTTPFDGVIVRWRVRGDSFAAQLSLRIVQAQAPTVYTGVATGTPETVAPGVENVFSTRMPVKQGQSIGVDVPGAAGAPRVETRSAPGAAVSIWFPTRLADGETRAHFTASADREALLNADIEADCDNDGFGDETQDPSLFGGSCPPLDRALVLDANKSKVKIGKKVTLSGLVNAAFDESGCRAGQTVELQRKKPSQAAFTTFAQVQTSPTGSFSLIQKVKKTFEYRAQVAPSPGCNAGTSNTERVKAKKPKK